MAPPAFQPVDVRTRGGDAHQIRHPENAFLLRSNIILGSPESDDFEFLALLHAAEVKAVPGSAEDGNESTGRPSAG